MADIILSKSVRANLSALQSTAQLISQTQNRLATGKRVFSRQLEMPLDEAYAFAGRAIAADFFGADGKEGVEAFLGKRTPRWGRRA